MPDNADTPQATPVVTVTPPLKEVTAQQLAEKVLAKILADCGLTMKDLLDNTNPTKRMNYMKTVRSSEATPMPTADEEADLMAERIGINVGRFGGRGAERIREIIAAQESACIDRSERGRLIREHDELIKSSPRPLVWIAKFLVFLKNIFKRRK